MSVLRLNCSKKMEQEYNNIATWVQGKLLRGRHIFSQEEVWNVFQTITHENVTRSLTRLCSRKILMTPMQGFYVILPLVKVPFKVENLSW